MDRGDDLAEGACIVLTSIGEPHAATASRFTLRLLLFHEQPHQLRDLQWMQYRFPSAHGLAC